MRKLKDLSLIMAIFASCLACACKSQLPCPPAAAAASPSRYFPVTVSKDQYAGAPNLDENDIEGFLRDRLANDGSGRTSGDITKGAFFTVYKDQAVKQYKLSFAAQISEIAAALTGSNVTVTTTTYPDGTSTISRTIIKSSVDEKLSLALNNIPTAVGLVCSSPQATSLAACEGQVTQTLTIIHQAATKSAFVVMPSIEDHETKKAN
jgi:hypothetical protein